MDLVLTIAIMGFFQTIKNSIYSHEFYARIPSNTFRSALKFFLLRALLLSFILIIPTSWSLITSGSKTISNVVTQVVKYYPSELEIHIKNGVISSNVREPYFIPLPRSVTKDERNLDNLLVIDTVTPYTASAFGNYRSYAWLSKDSLFYLDSSSTIKNTDLSKVKEFTFNRSTIDTFVTKLTPFYGYVGPVLSVIIFIFTYIGYLFNWVYLLFAALVVLLLSSLFKWSLSYSSAYKIAMYAITLPLLVDLGLSLTGKFHGFPFMFSLITFIVVLLNLKSAGPISSPPEIPQPPKA